MTEPAYTEQDLRKSFEVAQNAGYCIVTDSGVTYPDFDKDSDLVKSYAAEFARIRSEARAGMREACAKFGDEGGCNCDYPETQGKHGHASYCPLGVAAAIRDFPDIAADEAIERIKREARLEGQIIEAKRQPHEDTYEGSCGVHMPRFCSTCRRIAALSGKETSHD